MSGPLAYLLAARALRDFGDGFVAILLPVYLLALGYSPLEIGAIATSALLAERLLVMAALACHEPPVDLGESGSIRLAASAARSART